MKVFSTSRALRNFYTQSLDKNQFIDKAITLGELFSKMVLVPNRSFADYETRLLLLSEASQFENFTKLQIQRDLFSFLHNSQYIFRFFEELSGEGVDITTIDAADTYVEYEEHLAILIQLRENYKALLDQKQLTDAVFLPEHAQLNLSYIKGIESLKIALEGYFTNYELRLLQEASLHIPITLTLHANEYNSKMQTRFKELGFDIESGFSYIINLSSKNIDDKKPYNEALEVTTSSFSERLLQVGFVKQQISRMIREDGIAAEDIVVILPTEGFAQTLALYDDENIFNFAMGLPFSDSLFIRRINAITDYFDHPVQEQKHRKNRLIEGVESAFELLRIHYSETVSMALFEKIIETFCVGMDEKSIEIINKELFSFSKLTTLLVDATLKMMLQLFMQRLSSATYDDVRGGKITVMGLLETRGTSFRGVIVVDFNDEFIPKKSQKDLFLSSSIKTIVGLPTPKDRESLQKYFYRRLFEQADRVALSYVSSDTQMPSRFLTELGIAKSKVAEDEAGFASILYDVKAVDTLKQKELIADYDFTKQPLSATGLKTFLECKRKFYHRYVSKLKGHEIPLDMPKESEIGSWLHALLEVVYSKNRSFSDVDSLKREVEEAFKEHKGKGEMGRYLVRLWLEKLTPFYELEIEHFKDNYEVYACEKAIQTVHMGIPITGVIDRLDIRDGMLQVIDYKSGTINRTESEKQLEKTTEFQLEFYALLARNLGEVSDAFYYDLKHGKLLKEIMLEEKLAKLDDIFSYLTSHKSFDFEMTEDKAVCKFCDYVHLCGKGL
jgi:ATP-dependent helicase/nuclease subunit B